MGASLLGCLVTGLPAVVEDDEVDACPDVGVDDGDPAAVELEDDEAEGGIGGWPDDNAFEAYP